MTVKVHEVQEQRVKDYMSSPVIMVDQDTPLKDAASIMALRNIGNVVVVDRAMPLGIVTEREILQYLVLNKILPNKAIKFVLNKKYSKVTPTTSIIEAARMMITKKSRLLVFEKDRTTRTEELVGIITASDLVRAFFATGDSPSIKDSMTNTVYTMHPNDTIFAAVKLMFKKRVGSVVVTANGGPEGIFTEREIFLQEFWQKALT
jgi:CBS domain-containing protein